MQDWWIIAVIGVVAGTMGLTALIRTLAIRYRIVDSPDGERKRHGRDVALLGGVSVGITFFAALWIVELTTGLFTTGMISRMELTGFTAAGALLLAYGIADDIKALRPRWSLLVSIAAALIVVASGIEISKVSNPLGGQISLIPIISDALVFLWIILMIYSMKLLDGVDGLVTGMGTIASFVIAFLALTALYFQPDVALMAFLFAGALVGFLAFNYPPATMFLGESGSVLIGFVIAVFAVIAGSKVATALLVVGLPAIDMFAVITHRLKRRNPLMKGDRLHLHFKLQDRGFKDESILFIYWATCLAFGLSTLIFESWQKLIALSVLLIATAIGIIVVSSKPYAK